MAFVVKFVKTVRNNWKKSLVFTCATLYGINYAKTKYTDGLLQRAYCQEAKKFGEVPLRIGEKSRRVLVFLNPAAKRGKGKKLFEANVAPILHLAGLDVTIVKTEYEGQAKKYMSVVEDTDAIIVAGGDGTLLEVITGLLRRPDQERASQIPIGVVPTGLTNSMARVLHIHADTEVRWLLEAAMSVVYNQTKPQDVFYMKAETGDVYSVSGMQWGAFKEAELRKAKYWLLGALKHRFTYLLSVLGSWPPEYAAEFSYTNPCDGCSRCFKVPERPPWRWWHIFMPPQPEVPQRLLKSG